MSAFLKIDECVGCHRSIPWEWTPAVVLGGRPLAGTGVWGSSLTDGLCSTCIAIAKNVKEAAQRAEEARKCLTDLLGGVRPYTEFTFERYRVTPGNSLAFESARNFCPTDESLYLWGPCGVGKTHLALAAARRCVEETLSVNITPAYQLSRRIRMKDPLVEQAAIDVLVDIDVLVLDDLGTGSDSPFSRQLLQEILDRRAFANQNGLLITTKYSLDGLASKLGDDSIPSRLAGMCSVIEVRGDDARILRRP